MDLQEYRESIRESGPYLACNGLDSSITGTDELAGKNAGPRGTATAGIVELSQPEASGGQCIKMMSFDSHVKTTKVTEAKIVDQNAEKIGLLGSLFGKGKKENGEPKKRV